MTVTNEGTCQGTCDKFKSLCAGTQWAGIKVAKTICQCKREVQTPTWCVDLWSQHSDPGPPLAPVTGSLQLWASPWEIRKNLNTETHSFKPHFSPSHVYSWFCLHDPLVGDQYFFIYSNVDGTREQIYKQTYRNLSLVLLVTGLL